MAVRIAHGSLSGTCIESIRLGEICILLPFFLVAFPNSLQFPNFTHGTLVATALLCISTIMLSATIYGGFMGKLNSAERGFMLLGPMLRRIHYKWPHP